MIDQPTVKKLIFLRTTEIYNIIDNLNNMNVTFKNKIEVIESFKIKIIITIVKIVN